MSRLISALFILYAVFTAGCTTSKPPEWIGGKSILYPEEAYFIGVGVGESRSSAEDRSRSQIAKIFDVRIQAQDISEESQWLAKVGEITSSEYGQTAQSRLTATTDKVLRGVTVAEVWKDEEGKVFHALAVMDRLKTARWLRSDIDDIDHRVTEELRLANLETSSLPRLRRYLAAAYLLSRRGALAADLRIVDPAGWASDPPASLGEVAAKAAEMASNIHIRVDMRNDREGIVRGALVRELADLGMKVFTEAESDVTVSGDVFIEGYRLEEPWFWTVASAQVEVTDGEGRILAARRLSVREGSRVEERSETMAREKLGESLAAIMLESLGAKAKE